MKVFEKIKQENRIIYKIFGIKFKFKIKSKIEILRNNHFSIITFIKNLYYLSKYNIKDIYNTPNLNICEITELAAIKTKFLWNDIKTPIIKDDIETIKELVTTNKSIIRMGDGEFNLMLGENNIFEKSNKVLQETFKKIFYNDDPNLLIGTRYDMFKMDINFLHNNIDTYRFQYLLKNYEKIKNLYNYSKIYYSACFVYPYNVYASWNQDIYFDLMQKIWAGKNITIITGTNVFKKIKYNIFENASNINYIYGPNKNSFDKYDEISEKIKHINKDNILCFALGPCGKKLAYDFYKKGYRVLDLGHLIKNYDFYKKKKNMSESDYRKNFKNFMKPD